MEANALVDTLADKIANQVQKFYNTVGEVKAEVLVFKVASRIAVLSGKPHEDNADQGVGSGDGQYTGW